MVQRQCVTVNVNTFAKIVESEITLNQRVLYLDLRSSTAMCMRVWTKRSEQADDDDNEWCVTRQTLQL